MRNISNLENKLILISDGTGIPLISEYIAKNIKKENYYTFKFIAINQIGCSNLSPK
jgi:hypothetical protein